MGKIVIYVFIAIMLISCAKDKTQVPCTGVEMTGDKSRLVGTWRWYSTRVEQWFDIGPSSFLNYTPVNQIFEYFFTISPIGEFKGYKNDTLVHYFLLSSVQVEHFDSTSVSIVTNVVEFSKDCSNQSTSFYQLSNNHTNDSLFSLTYPLNFNDEENHLISKRNFFVKE
jgi:hypothetical protein